MATFLAAKKGTCCWRYWSWSVNCSSVCKHKRNFPVFFPDSGDFFTRAVQAVILDEGFQVESLQARTALKTASLVLEWCREQDHGEKLDSFSHILVVWLKVCFASQHTTVQLQKEWMWGAYHQLRTAETFVKDWRMFSANFVGQKAFPAFSSLLHTPFSSGWWRLGIPLLMDLQQDLQGGP